MSGALPFVVLADEGEAGGSVLGPTAARAPTLPLDLDQLGFRNGQIEATAADEGPDAIGFCNRAPDTDGLITWSGNRLTEPGSRRRVAQMVVRFRSSVDAARFMTSTAATGECDGWEAESGSELLQFDVTEQLTTTIRGDETRRFDVRAGSDGPDLFLRVVMIRSGPEVTHLTVVSANQQDLQQVDQIADEASDRLGYS